jgi:SET domain-containing protein
MASQKSTTSSGQKPDRSEPNEFYEVRRSGVHGYGGFARKDLKKGTRVTEYLGDRISHKEADQRYEDHDENDNHTFLFIVDKQTVIDAGVGGNNARFINHQCDPNCESTIEKGRVWIETIRAVKQGEELGYDYQIGREKDDPENVDEIYACRCGSPKCRGTMLFPATIAEFRKELAKKAAARKRKSAGKSKNKNKKGKRKTSRSARKK